MNREQRELAVRLAAEERLAALLPEAAGPEPEAEVPRWARVADEHPRWEIKNPLGDGRHYLLSDEAIRTFGRAHLTKLVADLPPLLEEAWTPPPRKDDRLAREVGSVLGEEPDT